VTFPVFAIRALSYFKDAESDPMPRMIIPVNWQELKTLINRQGIHLNLFRSKECLNFNCLCVLCVLCGWKRYPQKRKDHTSTHFPDESEFLLTFSHN
jgi:hypothetical protein